MSSGVGYGYTFEDRAAIERRRQRAEIARLNARLGLIRAQAAQARALGAGRIVVAPDETPAERANDAELTRAVSSLAEAVAAGEAAVGRALEQHWSAALRRAVDEELPAGRAAPLSAPAAAQRSTVPAPRARPDAPASADPKAARSAAAQEVRQLVAETAARCLPADLERINSLCASLADLTTTAAIRERAHEIRDAVKKSMRRREDSVRVQEERARLLALVGDVPTELRGTLIDEIAAASDPAALAQRVAATLDDADAERRRRAVAAIAANALRGIGCVVAEDFGSSLAARGEVVAPFEGSRYGLLIRLTAGRDRMAAAVVRRDDEAADNEEDIAAQRAFCADGLAELTGQLTAAGLGLRSFYRAEPGHPPPGAYDAQAWESVGVTRRTERPRDVAKPKAKEHGQ